MTAKIDNPPSPEAASTPKASHGFCVQRLVRIRLFNDGIATGYWRHFGPHCWTALRWRRTRKGLFGVMAIDGGLTIGLLWGIRFELVAVHENRFLPNT